MRSVLRGFCTAAVISVAFESDVVAQNFTIPDTNQRIQLSLYGLGIVELTPEIEQTIATWTNPIIVTVEAGQSVRDAALEVCPNASQEYFNVFESVSSDLNPHIAEGLDVNEPLEDRGVLLAPNCLQRNAQRITVLGDQAVEREIWQKYVQGVEDELESLGVAPNDFTQSIATLNGRSVDSMSDIRAGEQILVPLPRADFVTTPEGLNAITDAVTQSYGSGVVSHELYNSLSNGQFSELSDDIVQEGVDNCSRIDDATLYKQHLVQFAKMHEALYWNLRQARRAQRAASKSVRASETNVAVFDTGLPHSERWLYGSLVSPLQDGDRMSMMVDEFVTVDKIDLLKEHPWADHAALDGVLDRALHTEKVLGAAMGGYHEYMFNSSFGVIVPSVKSIFFAKEETDFDNRRYFIKLVTDDFKIAGAIENATEVEASHIVNISAGTERDPDKRIFTALSKAKDENDLFIVSAGNFRSNESLDQSKFYPANYGGVHSADLPLITVGGYKWVFAQPTSSEAEVDVAPWDNTNYGDHVDLMALGCDVPTVDFSDASSRNFATIDYENGTSLAAPRVTFTAAMIRYLMSHHDPLDRVKYSVPIAIKHRILASSDLHPELEAYSVDGRVLNFAKAINIFSDVVDMGSHDYLRGQVEFTDTTFTCNGQEKFNTQDILKIARRIDPKDDKKIDYIYYFVKDNSPAIETCSDWRKPDMYFIPFSLSSEPDQQPIGDFEDIVFSMYPE